MQIQIIYYGTLFTMTTSIHIKLRKVQTSDLIKPPRPSWISALFNLDLAVPITP